MEKTIKIPNSIVLSLCALGPGLKTENLLALEKRRSELNASSLYMEELDVIKTTSSGVVSDSLGILASFPFCNITKDSAIRLIEKTELYGCGYFAFGLPLGMFLSKDRKAVEEYLKGITNKAKRTKTVVSITSGLLSEKELERAVLTCMDSGCNTICLGTGTKLDKNLENDITVLVNILNKHGFSKDSLEIALNTNTILNVSSINQLLQNELHRVRLCNSRTNISGDFLNFERFERGNI
jgi:deoxyribose-phosphate aldolase